MQTNSPTAALIIIGNEILSGRTQDKNLNYIAKALVKRGIVFAHVRVISDVEAEIVDTVNELRARYDYVFTTGGIGPTHDDITSASVAKAFGVNLILHPEALKRLEEHYQNKANLTPERLKMAHVPEGASLIDNPLSGAPGFAMENVFVMAGIPSIMQVMADAVIATLKEGAEIFSMECRAFIAESKISVGLEKIQEKHADLDIGSYPFHDVEKGYGTVLVVRGVHQKDVQLAHAAIETLVEELQS